MKNKQKIIQDIKALFDSIFKPLKIEYHFDSEGQTLLHQTRDKIFNYKIEIFKELLKQYVRRKTNQTRHHK